MSGDPVLKLSDPIAALPGHLRVAACSGLPVQLVAMDPKTLLVLARRIETTEPRLVIVERPAPMGRAEAAMFAFVIAQACVGLAGLVTAFLDGFLRSGL